MLRINLTYVKTKTNTAQQINIIFNSIRTFYTAIRLYKSTKKEIDKKQIIETARILINNILNETAKYYTENELNDIFK